MWPAFLFRMPADGAEHIRVGLDGEVETPATPACQMPRASSYFLARSEGWRGLLRRSALSNACWMGGGAPARSRSKRLVLRACTSVLALARSEGIADQRMRRLVGLADPPRLQVRLRLGKRLFQGIDLFGFEFDGSGKRALGGEHGLEQVAGFKPERLTHALGKCDLTLGTHFLVLPLSWRVV